MAKLSESELEAYKMQGFVVPEFRLSATQLAQLKDALDRVISANP